MLIKMVSADDDEFVTLYVVSYRMGESDCNATLSKREPSPDLAKNRKFVEKE